MSYAVAELQVMTRCLPIPFKDDKLEERQKMVKREENALALHKPSTFLSYMFMTMLNLVKVHKTYSYYLILPSLHFRCTKENTQMH